MFIFINNGYKFNIISIFINFIIQNIIHIVKYFCVRKSILFLTVFFTFYNKINNLMDFQIKNITKRKYICNIVQYNNFTRLRATLSCEASVIDSKIGFWQIAKSQIKSQKNYPYF